MSLELKTNSQSNSQENPLLATTGLPPFHLVKAEHVLPAVEQVVEKVGDDLQKLEASLSPTWDGLVEPFMKLGEELTYAWSPVYHLLSVRNTDAMRDAFEQAQPLVVELSLRIGQSKPIYEGLKTLAESDEYAELTTGQQRTIEKYIQAAEHAGVGLEGQDKERFLEIQRELSQLSNDFSNHVLDATKAFGLNITDAKDTAGWPTILKQLAAQAYQTHVAESSEAGSSNQGDTVTPENGPWRITLDYPVYGPFMQHSQNPAQRETVYRAFARRAADEPLDNSLLLEKILKLHAEQAQLLGFETYADLSLSTKMAGQVSQVDQMYAQLDEAARQASIAETQALEAFAQANPQLAGEGQTNETLMPWDVAFWSERMREARFGFTDEQLRPYFPMPRVLEGLFELCGKLFDIRFECDVNEPTVWHEDVAYYRVFNGENQEIAGFYLDPYARPADKRGGAWMGDCLGRRVEEDGRVRVPVAHLICNGTPPTKDTPSLMSFREVETLFHEFGHGLQHMLTTQDIPAVAGISNVEWDAVELPSQFMENWCLHQPVLMGMTQHIETGESLPEDLFNKLVESKTFMAGSHIMRQMSLGQTDLTLYRAQTPPEAEAAHEIALKISRDLIPTPTLDEARMLCSFSHIFAGGYSAGYFSYLWAEVLSADAFAAFEEAGLDDEQKVRLLGRRFRDTVLSLGGSQHPMAIYRAFRGREPDSKALLRHQGLLD